MSMSIEEEISFLEKVVENLWEPLISGSTFPETYIKDKRFKESFTNICERFYLLLRDKDTKDKEMFEMEKNALFEKLDKFFKRYPKISFVQKSWCSREGFLWRPLWIEEHFENAILQNTIWYEILRLKELIEHKQQQRLKDLNPHPEESKTEDKDVEEEKDHKVEFTGVAQRNNNTRIF